MVKRILLSLKDFLEILRTYVCKLDAVVKRFEELTEKLADPTIYDRQARVQKLARRGLLLRRLRRIQGLSIFSTTWSVPKRFKFKKYEDLRSMAKEELSEIEAELPPMEERLKILLLPKDPLDAKNVMVEIRAGAGGDEASISLSEMFIACTLILLADWLAIRYGFNFTRR